MLATSLHQGNLIGRTRYRISYQLRANKNVDIKSNAHESFLDLKAK